MPRRHGRLCAGAISKHPRNNDATKYSFVARGGLPRIVCS